MIFNFFGFIISILVVGPILYISKHKPVDDSIFVKKNYKLLEIIASLFLVITYSFNSKDTCFIVNNNKLIWAYFIIICIIITMYYIVLIRYFLNGQLKKNLFDKVFTPRPLEVLPIIIVLFTAVLSTNNILIRIASITFFIIHHLFFTNIIANDNL